MSCPACDAPDCPGPDYCQPVDDPRAYEPFPSAHEVTDWSPAWTPIRSKEEDE